MRRATALIAGLVLVGGLVGCGQDSSGNANEDFCTALTDLQKDVDEFNSMVTSGASVDELGVQANAVAASAKDVSADAQRLDDQAAKDAMNQASLDLQKSVTAATSASLSPAEQTTALKAAVDQYEATATQVSTQVGCTTG
jgi:hypothetical protein